MSIKSYSMTKRLCRIGLSVFLSFTFIFQFSTPSWAIEDRYLDLRRQEMDAKQRQADHYADRIESIQKQLETQRESARRSQEQIWKNYSDTVEVKRKNLRAQIDAVNERQKFFEHEFRKKRKQDKIRIRERKLEGQRESIHSSREQIWKDYSDTRSSCPISSCFRYKR